MNNAKIWLVVKPTVGIPLFLGAVAGTSLFVHWNLLHNATWVQGFVQGKPKKSASLDVPAQPGVGQAAVVVFRDSATSPEALVVLPDGRTAKAVFDGRTTVASTALDAVK